MYICIIFNIPTLWYSLNCVTYRPREGFKYISNWQISTYLSLPPPHLPFSHAETLNTCFTEIDTFLALKQLYILNLPKAKREVQDLDTKEWAGQPACLNILVIFMPSLFLATTAPDETKYSRYRVRGDIFPRFRTFCIFFSFLKKNLFWLWTGGWPPPHPFTDRSVTLGFFTPSLISNTTKKIVLYFQTNFICLWKPLGHIFREV